MRAVIQRVVAASVDVDGVTIGAIGVGLCIVVGIGHSDSEEIARHFAARITTLRIFTDDDGKMNNSLIDVGGAALIISQFTLHADTHKGHRPSFLNAAPPEKSIPLYETFVDAMRATGTTVSTGAFGKHMVVRITNDGPITIVLSSGEDGWATDAG